MPRMLAARPPPGNFSAALPVTCDARHRPIHRDAPSVACLARMGGTAMSMVRTEQHVRLTCLSEPHMIETLDIDQLVDDLTDGTPPSFLTPERICVQDLIVVATVHTPSANPGAKAWARAGARSGVKPDPNPGRYLGLLGLRDD